MKRKFLGLFLLLSVVAVISACGGSSAADDDDECLLDPDSVNCTMDEDPAEFGSGE